VEKKKLKPGAGRLEVFVGVLGGAGKRALNKVLRLGGGTGVGDSNKTIARDLGVPPPNFFSGKRGQARPGPGGKADEKK